MFVKNFAELEEYLKSGVSIGTEVKVVLDDRIVNLRVEQVVGVDATTPTEATVATEPAE